MASGSQYPVHLNPFGSDDEDDNIGAIKRPNHHSSVTYNQDQYPDHLDPFSTPDDHAPSVAGLESKTPTDDYDDSLNPFGQDEPVSSEPNESFNRVEDCHPNDGNPFAEDDDVETQSQSPAQLKQDAGREAPTVRRSPSPELLEPPKPLPRTKSLLKKEQALKKRLQEQQSVDNQANSLLSTTSSASTSSIPEPSSHQSSTAVGTFQRQKNKRLAPPVPVNFKRQVSGSLNAIQEELNEIGDKLEVIDKESNICQQTLTSGETLDDFNANTVRSKIVELIRERNSIVKRQKELMYKKRELKLDQLHSDIEYELRMIGNKQQSTRTKEDDSKEKDLLKKLVEIIEEKNDIIENLNKDTSCDSSDVEEALKRLNIHDANNSSEKTVTNNTTAQAVSKGSESCDKKRLTRLSKIATLLPRGDTIKMKRKRLFKKNCDSRPIER